MINDKFLAKMFEKKRLYANLHKCYTESFHRFGICKKVYEKKNKLGVVYISKLTSLKQSKVDR